MCLLVPGKIISIKDGKAVVDYDIEQREGAILEDKDNADYKEGDYVLIQSGIIVDKIPEKEARESLEMYKKAVNQQE